MKIWKRVLNLLLIPSIMVASELDLPQEKVNQLSVLGTFVGKVTYAGIDYRPFYLKLMQIERKHSWSEQQIALIGVYFSAEQGREIQRLTNENKQFTPDEISLLKSQLNHKLDSLNHVRFNSQATLHTKMLCYYMGTNNTELNSAIIYPINIPNPTMFLRVEDDSITSVEVRRVTDSVLTNSFSKELWDENRDRNRLNIVKDLFAQHTLQGMEVNEIVELLGEPDTVYLRDYGYEELEYVRNEKPWWKFW